MSEQLLDLLEAHGVAAKEAAERLGGNCALYLRVLRRFTEDRSCALLCEAAVCADAHKGLLYSHTLKGIAANLGFSRLSELTQAQCGLFRSGDTQEAFALTGDIEAECSRLTALLEEVNGQS